MSTWLNDWQSASLTELEHHFGLSEGRLADIDLLLASYTQGDDSGYAFILYRFDGKLYEINASHDSELDFRHQWQPEETSIEALLFRLKRGNLGSASASENVFADELHAVLMRLMQ